jgi:hypothetical protein
MDRKSNVINLSRVAFEDLKLGKPTVNSTSQMVYIDGQDRPALCVCFASVYEDHTQEASGGAYPAKTLYAIMHQQEYELKVTNLCLLMKVPFIRSQVDNNRMAFTTRPANTRDVQSNMEQSSLRFPGEYLTCFFLFY